MNRSFLYTLIIAIISISCQSNNNRAHDPGYFNGEVLEIEDLSFSDKLHSERISLEEPVFGLIAIQDSILFSYHPRSDGFQYQSINLNTKKLHAKYFPLGKGPKEFLNVTPIFQQMTNRKGDIVSPFVAVNEFKYGIFNITESIKTKQTILDTVIDLQWEENFINPFIFIFSINDSLVLAKKQPNNLSDKTKYTLPEYQLLNFHQSEAVKKIEVFKHFNNKNIGELNESILLSYDKIKPDKTKLAMAMVYMAQVNILDLKTGVSKGIRLKKTPDIDELEKLTEKEMKIYFKDIAVSDEYIYALYIDSKNEENDFHENLKSDIIYVYDWEGNVKKKIKLDKELDNIAIDKTNTFLYGITAKSMKSEIYRYKMDKWI